MKTSDCHFVEKKSESELWSLKDFWYRKPSIFVGLEKMC